MTRFVDVYLGPRIQGFPVDVVPMWSTQIARADSGREVANQRWGDALRDISIPAGVRKWEDVEALRKHWLVMAGPAHTWPWRDPTDFASVDLTEVNIAPTTTALDTQFATGDGVTLAFQLTKTYDIGSPALPYVRQITCPVVSTVQIAVAGAVSSPSNWTVSRNGGVVTFDTPPANGAALTWGGLFDLQVRFESDDTLRSIMQSFRVSGFADIPLKEVPYCED